jgi:hypothetical protein
MASLKAVKEADGLIRCEIEGGRAGRATYWIDPEKGILHRQVEVVESAV